MRVVFVAALPPDRSSMVGRILPLARAVRAAGHEVVLYTLSGTDTRHQVTTPVDTWFRTVGPNIRPTDDTAPSPFHSLLRWRSGMSGLRRALATEEPDVVVLTKPQLQNTAPALELAQRTGAPLVVDTDDLEAEASRLPWPFRAHAATLEARAARAASLITACSPYLVEYYRALVQQQTSEVRERHTSEVCRVEMLPTGIDVPAHVSPANLRQRLCLPADAKIILYVGSLSLASGHRVDTLIWAFVELVRSSVPDTEGIASPRPRAGLAMTSQLHLVIAGSGLDETKLQRLTTLDSRLATRVHFLGRFSPPEDLALAHEADLLVDPVDSSPVSQAKSSHRLLLALATGTPIVAGAVGMRPFLLPTRLHDLCLYDAKDPHALPSALARGLASPMRTRFAETTRGCVQRYTWVTLGARFARLLEDSVTARAARVPARIGERIT